MYGTACLLLGRAAHVHRRLYKHARLVTPDTLMSLMHNGTAIIILQVLRVHLLYTHSLHLLLQGLCAAAAHAPTAH